MVRNMYDKTIQCRWTFLRAYMISHQRWQQGAFKACNPLVNKSIIEAKQYKKKIRYNIMDTDTKPLNDKQCSKCGENKTEDKFIKKEIYAKSVVT